MPTHASFPIDQRSSRSCEKAVDKDQSGEITFDELTTCVRRELKKGPKAISHNELKALWCALDATGDNQVTGEDS